MRKSLLAAALLFVCSPLLAATFTVTTAADSGAGSLRQAILDANAAPGADLIRFAIGSGPVTITVATGLPAITDGVTIDAATQNGFTGAPLVELRIANGINVNGLEINASSCTIRGFAINRFLVGILIQGSNNVVAGNWFNLALDGVTRADDPGLINYGTADVRLLSGSGNRIGGNTAADRNVLDGYSGVSVAGAGVTIEGNFFKNARIVADGSSASNYGSRHYVIDGNTYDNGGGATIFSWDAKRYSSTSSIFSALGFEKTGRLGAVSVTLPA